MPGIDVEFFPPDESFLLALLHNRLEEAPEDIDSIALTDTGQTGMVGQRLAQVIAKTTTTRLGRSAAWRISWRSERSGSREGITAPQPPQNGS